MNEPRKLANNEIVRKQLSVDSDELQLLDECNCEWVDAWKAAAEQMTESQTTLVETKKP
jgi:hypothetical protein